MAKNPNPVDRHVGSSVRARPQALGLSQTALASKLGLTFQQVQKYEKGTNRIGSSRLQHIANILQVPIEFFFDGAPGQSKWKSKAPDIISEFVADADGRSLMRAFVRIRSTGVRRNVVNLVKSIADRRGK